MTDPAKEFVKRLEAYTGTAPIGESGFISIQVNVPNDKIQLLREVADILGLSLGDALWDRTRWMFDEDTFPETIEFARDDAAKAKKP